MIRLPPSDVPLAMPRAFYHNIAYKCQDGFIKAFTGFHPTSGREARVDAVAKAIKFCDQLSEAFYKDRVIETREALDEMTGVSDMVFARLQTEWAEAKQQYLHS